MTDSSETPTPSSPATLIDPPTIAALTVGGLVVIVVVFCAVGSLVHWCQERRRGKRRRQLELEAEQRSLLPPQPHLPLPPTTKQHDPVKAVDTSSIGLAVTADSPDSIVSSSSQAKLLPHRPRQVYIPDSSLYPPQASSSRSQTQNAPPLNMNGATFRLPPVAAVASNAHARQDSSSPRHRQRPALPSMPSDSSGTTFESASSRDATPPESSVGFVTYPKIPRSVNDKVPRLTTTSGPLSITTGAISPRSPDATPRQRPRPRPMRTEAVATSPTWAAGRGLISVVLKSPTLDPGVCRRGLAM